MKYAPHEGSFASRGGLVEQITFAADQGFTAWEDNEAVARPDAQLDAMAKPLQQRGMTMGVLVASMPKWSQFRPLPGADHGAALEPLRANLPATDEVPTAPTATRITLTAWEDNEAVARPVAQLDAMAKALQQRGMTMGVLVASMPKWSQFRPLLGADDGADREAFLADLPAAIEVAKRLNATWLTVVTGFMDPKVPIDLQTARVIEVMRRVGDIAARANRVLVMEPLNTITNHPNIFMRTITQGYLVAKGVNSPGVKVLADLYHAQIQAGNQIGRAHV